MSKLQILPVGEEPPPLKPPGQSSNAGESVGRKNLKGKTVDPVEKSGGRFALLNTFVDVEMADLKTRAEIAVWLVLYRDTRDGTARTGISDIARRAGCNRSTVFRALRRLEERSLLTKVSQGGLRSGMSRYRVQARQKDG
jgi:IclR helix-turn-helix domain